jgi:DNA-binding transcriptional ArsR family regulator
MSDSLFKALADPTRREVLKRLQAWPATAGELAEEFPQAKATLSHHFNVLKAAGLVRSERKGQHVVYSLNTSVFEDLARMMADLFKPERRSQ